MVIIGFDYSTKNISYSVLVDGKFLEWDNYEYEDIVQLSEYLEDLLFRVKPYFVAVEGLFLRTNPHVLIELANIQGIIKLMGQKFNECPPLEITPEQAKRAVGVDVYRKPYKGSKPKEKKQMVVNTVNALFGVKCPNHDIADAMAVAWTAWELIASQKLYEKEIND